MKNKILYAGIFGVIILILLSLHFKKDSEKEIYITNIDKQIENETINAEPIVKIEIETKRIPEIKTDEEIPLSGSYILKIENSLSIEESNKREVDIIVNEEPTEEFQEIVENIQIEEAIDNIEKRKPIEE